MKTPPLQKNTDELNALIGGCIGYSSAIRVSACEQKSCHRKEPHCMWPASHSKGLAYLTHCVNSHQKPDVDVVASDAALTASRKLSDRTASIGFRAICRRHHLADWVCWRTIYEWLVNFTESRRYKINKGHFPFTVLCIMYIINTWPFGSLTAGSALSATWQDTFALA